MRSRNFLCLFSTLFCLLLVCGNQAMSLPFSAEGTTRESLQITGDTSHPYNQLTYASGGLSFQLLDSGRIFEAFESKDPSVDNYGPNKCTTADLQQIYWVDKTSGWPGVCVSTFKNPDTGTIYEGGAASSNPKIGGPVNEGPAPFGDAGRYVIFETYADNIITAAVSSGVYSTKQIAVHDRKWEKAWTSKGKCTDAGIPNGNSDLGMISDDGRYVLLSSAATNIIDNLSPNCTDSNGAIVDIFLRDGKSCKDPGLGACTTNVLYDQYGLHAGENTVDLLDQDSANPAMTEDRSIIVFQTEATIPIHYNPDILGHTDIYLYNGTTFSLLSQRAVLVEDATTHESTPMNIGGAANGDSMHPSIANDGKIVVFDSVATDLVVDTNAVDSAATGSDIYIDGLSSRQVYLYDLNSASISLISKNAAGTPGNGVSQNPRISRDGRYVAYESTATNLITGITTTTHRNIFVYDRISEVTYLVTPGVNPNYPSADTRTTQGLEADAAITQISEDGLVIAFETAAADAINNSLEGVVPDTNGVQDAFLTVNACPDDADSDGVPDCIDLCPSDAAKSDPGQCGCGQVDTDSDNDGIANCVDECQSDPAKSAPGVCGCGVADVDLNGNGTMDCLDITSDTVPPAPTVEKVSGKRKLIVTATRTLPGATYKFILTDGVQKWQKSSTNTSVSFGNLMDGVEYTAKYRIKKDGVTTKRSRPKTYQM